MALIKLKFINVPTMSVQDDFHFMMDNDEESEDFSAEEDDEDFLRRIFSAHPTSSVEFHTRESSEESLKKVILKEIPVVKDCVEQSTRNAEKLMLEEERDRLRLERRKDRKRRKRERKKAAKGASKTDCDLEEEQDNPNKVDNEQNVNANKRKHERNKKDKIGSSGEGSSEIDDDNEGFLDFNSAFVTKVVKHKLRSNVDSTRLPQVKSSINSPKDISSKSPKRSSNEKKPQDIPERNLQLGERLAAAGYQCASKERYEEAIELFTRALRNVPNDHRYWGNRSFCYFQIEDYQKALEDSNCAIELAPQSPKGYYRRAEALAGLKNLIAAEESFQRVLELDNDCDDAQKELLNIRMLRITEMGFNRKHAIKALLKHNTMEAAVDALMTSPKDFDTDSEEVVEVYNSDEEINWDEIAFTDRCSDNHDNNFPPVQSQFIHTENIAGADKPRTSRKQAAMDPSNPNHCVSIWVGNIEETVLEMDLHNEFSRFGHISSIRIIPSSHCAFINFADSRAPGPAMAAMQGKELAGKNLLIRYPNKTKDDQQTLCHQRRLQNGGGSFEFTDAEGAVGYFSPSNIPQCTASGTKTTLVPSAKGTRVKLKGPVNGDECYYWRTTGCAFGDNCRNKHLKENQGIDRKPWHK